MNEAFVFIVGGLALLGLVEIGRLVRQSWLDRESAARGSGLRLVPSDAPALEESERDSRGTDCRDAGESELFI